MMFHHVAIDVLLMVVSMQHIAAEMGFPTCDIFRKYGPILASNNYDVSPMSTSLISLQSGQSIPSGLVTNKSVQFKQVGQSSLLVTKIDSSGYPTRRIIVNAQTGKVQANEEIMDIIGSKTHRKFFSRSLLDQLFVTIHDDLTLVTYDSVKGKPYSFNLTTGESMDSAMPDSRLREEARPFDYLDEYPSLAVRDGKYCIIGGHPYIEHPMICYDKSNRNWTTSKKIKINRELHSSLWYNGVLYVCGGVVGNSWVDSCNLYNRSYGFIREISIACARTKFGRLYVVGDELNYAAMRHGDKYGKWIKFWSVSKLDRPSNCTDIAEYKSGFDAILDPFCPSIQLSDDKSAAKRLRLSILFSGPMLPFWIWLYIVERGTSRWICELI